MLEETRSLARQLTTLTPLTQLLLHEKNFSFKYASSPSSMPLQEKVEAIQSSRNEVSNSRNESDDEKEDGDGGLVPTDGDNEDLSGGSLSGTMTNADRKKRVEKIGVLDCDQICCPKLDGVLKVVFPRDAIKADGYLSLLQQF